MPEEYGIIMTKTVMMNEFDITYLVVSSWNGIHLGATHCYGKIHNGDNYVHLMRKLSAAGANKINGHESNEVGLYKKGMLTERFDNEHNLRKCASREYKRHFPNSNILLLGNKAFFEPKLVLDYPECFDGEKAINIFYEFSSETNKKNQRILTQEYYRLFR